MADCAGAELRGRAGGDHDGTGFFSRWICFRTNIKIGRRSRNDLGWTGMLLAIAWWRGATGVIAKPAGPNRSRLSFERITPNGIWH